MVVLALVRPMAAHPTMPQEDAETLQILFYY
jgi:hypothetical protein